MSDYCDLYWYSVECLIKTPVDMCFAVLFIDAVVLVAAYIAVKRWRERKR